MTRIRKALVAAASAFAAAIVATITTGEPLSAATIGAAVGLAVAAGYAVWRTPNATQ